MHIFLDAGVVSTVMHIIWDHGSKSQSRLYFQKSHSMHDIIDPIPSDWLSNYDCSLAYILLLDLSFCLRKGVSSLEDLFPQ